MSSLDCTCSWWLMSSLGGADQLAMLPSLLATWARDLQDAPAHINVDERAIVHRLQPVGKRCKYSAIDHCLVVLLLAQQRSHLSSSVPRQGHGEHTEHT